MTRFDYVKYDKQAQIFQEEAKKDFLVIEDTINQLSPGRATALALTKLEEAYMWVGKAIRDDQIARNGAAQLQEERTNS